MKNTNIYQITKLPTVAHAGGRYLGATYTNSLDALEHNKDNYEYFEIDFMKTSDDVYVCSHGWSAHERSLSIGDNINGAPSINEFLEKRKLHKWTACTAEEVIAWAHLNKKKIITDIKESNVEALAYLAEKFRYTKEVFIPQFYNINEYQPLKDIGYDKLIFTLYSTNINEEELLAWAFEKKYFLQLQLGTIDHLI